MANLPPFQSVDMGAVAIHETFMSFVRAGFTREEAMEFILQQMELAHHDLKRQQEKADDH